MNIKDFKVGQRVVLLAGERRKKCDKTVCGRFKGWKEICLCNSRWLSYRELLLSSSQNGPVSHGKY